VRNFPVLGAFLCPRGNFGTQSANFQPDGTEEILLALFILFQLKFRLPRDIGQAILQALDATDSLYQCLYDWESF
jgi:hypothetical protein